MTKVCPGPNGRMSRNASTCSSSYTRCAGPSSRTIAQKTQAGIGYLLGPDEGPGCSCDFNAASWATNSFTFA
jgi:hypothetical protein